MHLFNEKKSTGTPFMHKKCKKKVKMKKTG